MTERPGKPRGISSLSSGGDESIPTAVDAGGPPRPPHSDDHVTLMDAKAHKGFLDLSQQLGALDDTDFDSRYRLGEVLGRGGMGEVRLASDQRIGRTVALKVIRPDSAKRPRLRARFLFEAKMQGQLEHPSIVPVYDLGVRPDGSEFFTMRRVRGRTLHEILKALRLGEKGATVTWKRRKLLAALQSVCLAVEFAHQRGVVHRDLKPANIMLGDFGEVSVLDWGLAKLVNAPEVPLAPDRPSLDDVRSLDNTGVGEVLGSPGYMSPEQAVDSQSVGPTADVFALGAMLFEILTLRHLIAGETHADVTRATISGQYDAHIGKRFPELDVPPELEAICVTATAMDPRERYGRARDIADAIERFLAGDRDVARRRSMAGRHTRLAIAALAESVEAKTSDAARAARSRSIREVNHALAIDPQNQTALRTMIKIVTETPSTIASDADAEVRAGEAIAMRTASRRGSFAYLALSGNIALMGLLGVESVPALAASCAAFLAAALVTWRASRVDPPRAESGVVSVPFRALARVGRHRVHERALRPAGVRAEPVRGERRRVRRGRRAPLPLARARVRHRRHPAPARAGARGRDPARVGGSRRIHRDHAARDPLPRRRPRRRPARARERRHGPLPRAPRRRGARRPREGRARADRAHPGPRRAGPRRGRRSPQRPALVPPPRALIRTARASTTFRTARLARARSARGSEWVADSARDAAARPR